MISRHATVWLVVAACASCATGKARDGLVQSAKRANRKGRPRRARDESSGKSSYVSTLDLLGNSEPLRALHALARSAINEVEKFLFEEPLGG